MPKSFIQISDSHIDDEKLVMGVDSQANLTCVVEHISKQLYDALIFSGDLSHNGTINSYIRINEILKPLNNKACILPGNHDNKSNLAKIFDNSLLSNFQLNDWEIISIDSVQNEKVSGYLSDQKLQTLINEIKQSRAKYIVLCLHHPVVPMQSSWDDDLSLENSEDFFGVISQFPRVRAIIWGHAHQSSEFKYGSIKLFSCPSTAVQFCGPSSIGYNHYTLHDNGEINCKTRWL
ncbi:MAG TPA: metallophosphoesterase [Gammaproteobacteria bacterium]|jgi:Icc protein|nr:metallophosphoesterase [Gammaproteobacteria bacterium]|tara:strand:+ start:207 stop:908 length:702 start_codon:yes stop_codon:yes gene_type:complete